MSPPRNQSQNQSLQYSLFLVESSKKKIRFDFPKNSSRVDTRSEAYQFLRSNADLKKLFSRNLPALVSSLKLLLIAVTIILHSRSSKFYRERTEISRFIPNLDIFLPH